MHILKHYHQSKLLIIGVQIENQTGVKTQKNKSYAIETYRRKNIFPLHSTFRLFQHGKLDGQA